MLETHAISIIKNGYVFTMIFAYLKTKHKQLIRIYLKQRFKWTFHTHFVKTGIEHAVINALIQISRMNYFCVQISRKLKDKKLLNIYKQNTKVKNTLKRFQRIHK
jgi:hypothetical protein